MKFAISAGHNPDGKVACGASGFLKESTTAREITNLVVSKLNALGHTAYNCTCDNGTSVSDVLKKICTMSNSHKVDLSVSIHLNAGKGTGTEVLLFNYDGTKKQFAQNVLSNICALGYRNRGLKIRKDLYFLKHTNAQAMLIETFFCDTKADCDRYNAENIANAIVKGLVGQTVTTPTNNAQTNQNKPTTATPKPTTSEVDKYYINNDEVGIWQNAMNVGFDKKYLDVDKKFGKNSQAFAKAHNLYKGMKYNCPTAIKWLQKRLNYFGFKLTVDGKFGSNTDKAVKVFQKNRGLTQDGIVGLVTTYYLLKGVIL